MILAFDTYYFENKAKTVCIAFEDWTESENFQVFSEVLEEVAAYESGKFYKRELPCILSLLKKIPVQEQQIIVVDGFVFLDDAGKLGLGGYLCQELKGRIPVIGVAKNNFAAIEKNKKALLRGESKKPLYITSIGIDLDEAAEKIKMMKGAFRIPDLLKRLDMYTKSVGKEL